MIVVGLDPGSRHFGWGVVEKIGTRLHHRAHGVVNTDIAAPLGDRLVQIETELVEVVRAYAPTQASVESIFFDKNAQSAAKLGHARGVALLVCARAGLSIAEYAPALVKRTVTGSGAADKAQVAQMIRVLLGLPAPPRSDAADALAVAVTHLHRSPLMMHNGGAAAPARRRTVAKMRNIRGRSPV